MSNSNNQKPDQQKPLIPARVTKLASTALLTGALLAGSVAHAAVPGSLADRVAKVRSALEKKFSDVNMKRQSHDKTQNVADLGSFTNWTNFNNWFNWLDAGGGWQNWQDWANWLNWANAIGAINTNA
jgi:hypothetical protein